MERVGVSEVGGGTDGVQDRGMVARGDGGGSLACDRGVHGEVKPPHVPSHGNPLVSMDRAYVLPPNPVNLAHGVQNPQGILIYP